MSDERVLSPVEYGPWTRGYMPPSEHILIDELTYRGARVSMMCGGITPASPSWWLVTKGGDHGALAAIGLRLMELLAEWEEASIRKARREVTDAPPWLAEDLSAYMDACP